MDVVGGAGGRRGWQRQRTGREGPGLGGLPVRPARRTGTPAGEQCRGRRPRAMGQPRAAGGATAGVAERPGHGCVGTGRGPAARHARPDARASHRIARRVRPGRRQVPRRGRPGRHLLPGHGAHRSGPGAIPRARRRDRTGRLTPTQPGHDQALRPPRVRRAAPGPFVGYRPRRRGRRRGGLAHRPGRHHASGRDVRSHALGTRHHLGMGLQPVLVRSPAGLLPGDQAPVRRHEAVARSEPCHHEPGRGCGRPRPAEPFGAGQRGQVLRRAVRPRAGAGLRADARRDRRHLRPPPAPVPAPGGHQRRALSEPPVSTPPA